MTGRSRLKVGVDVPWVTSWSLEEVLGVRPCASLDGALALHQAERPEFGRPNYSRNHLNRQRWSVRRMLCPMCGQPTAHGDRWTQTGRLTTAGVLRARGLGPAVPADVADAQVVLNAGAIAPLHRACAERALEHCPHLGALPSTELLPFPERLTVLPLTIAAAPPHVLAAAPAAPIAVITFLQLCGITAETDPRWRRRLRDLAPDAA
jgi:hypothetical protein